MNKWELADKIQLRLRHESYEPSPGQIMDHVNHRIAEAAVDEIWMEFEEQRSILERIQHINPAAHLRIWARDLDEKDRRSLAQVLHVPETEVPQSHIEKHGHTQRGLRELATEFEKLLGVIPPLEVERGP